MISSPMRRAGMVEPREPQVFSPWWRFCGVRARRAVREEQCGAGPGGPGPAPSTARAAGGGRLSHRNVGGSASSPAP